MPCALNLREDLRHSVPNKNRKRTRHLKGRVRSPEEGPRRHHGTGDVTPPGRPSRPCSRGLETGGSPSSWPPELTLHPAPPPAGPQAPCITARGLCWVPRTAGSRQPPLMFSTRLTHLVKEMTRKLKHDKEQMESFLTQTQGSTGSPSLLHGSETQTARAHGTCARWRSLSQWTWGTGVTAYHTRCDRSDSGGSTAVSLTRLPNPTRGSTCCGGGGSLRLRPATLRSRKESGGAPPARCHPPPGPPAPGSRCTRASSPRLGTAAPSRRPRCSPISMLRGRHCCMHRKPSGQVIAGKLAHVIQ